MSKIFVSPEKKRARTKDQQNIRNDTYFLIF